MKVEFGNRAQIEQVKRAIYKAECEEKNGEFEVTIEFSGSYTKTVKALDKKSAEVEAEDYFFCEQGHNYNIDDVYVTTIVNPGPKPKPRDTKTIDLFDRC